MSSSVENIGHLIKRVQYRHHRAIDHKLSKLGLSLVQWNALREIDRNPDVSMQQLSELTFSSNQAFGTLSKRLMRDRLINRHVGVGRAIKHSLTAKGHKLMVDGQRLMTEALVQSFLPLSSYECNTLSNLLTKLLDGDDSCSNTNKAVRKLNVR
jgi:DNA-binding MarR family transcriptional regulator